MKEIFGAGWLYTVIQAQAAAMLSAAHGIQSHTLQADASRKRAAAECDYQRRQFNALIEARATHTVGKEG